MLSAETYFRKMCIQSENLIFHFVDRKTLTIFGIMKEKTVEKKQFIANLTLSKTNYILFGIGVLLITLGYFVMAKGEVYSFQSLSVAPLILLFGYLVVIPASILYKKKK